MYRRCNLYDDNIMLGKVGSIVRTYVATCAKDFQPLAPSLQAVHVSHRYQPCLLHVAV
jgi:hypothetical protein